MGETVDFESFVFDLVKRCIRKGNYGLRVRNCRVFRAKRYSAPNRGPGGTIQTDVSVEVFHRGASHPWLLWVWECKDYKGQVPVSDVEEFHAKLEQLGSDRTKGTIISRNGFQRGAVEYARAHGIGLARIDPDGKIKVIFYGPVTQRPTVSDDEFGVMLDMALSAPDYVPWMSRFFGITEGGRCTLFTGSLSDWGLATMPEDILAKAFLRYQLLEWRCFPEQLPDLTPQKRIRCDLWRVVRRRSVRRALRIIRLWYLSWRIRRWEQRMRMSFQPDANSAM
jgi:hypothetical protein